MDAFKALECFIKTDASPTLFPFPIYIHTYIYTQGLSKRFERFKFGILYVLIVKIRYNFTHK